MWVWHVPALYDAAAEHTGVHVLEHLTFTLAGFLYWWHLLSPVSTRLRREGTTPIVYMVSTKATVGFLGILLTFAPNAIFSYYANQPQYWGLDPDADQALAGVIMALEQSIVMGIALVVLFTRMLAQSEREEQRARALRARPEAASRAACAADRTIPRWPAIAPIRIASGATSVPGRTTESFSAAPSPITAPSPIASGPCRRTPAPILHVAPDPHRRLDQRRVGQLGALADAHALGDLLAAQLDAQLAAHRVERARLQLVQRADVVPVLADLVDVERHVVREQRREDVVRPVDERLVSGSSRRSPARTGTCRSCRGRTAPRPGPASPGSR